MVSTVLDSYRQLESKLYIVSAVLVVVVLALLLVFYLYNQNAATYSISIQNYSQLYSKFNMSQNQLNAMTFKYDAAYYNLTNPYTKVLYNDYGVNIPKKNVSASNTNITHTGPTEFINITNIVTYYTYNFSFNATYPGYIILNASSTALNTQTNTTWEFVVSNYNIIPNGTEKYYNFQSGSGVYSPTITNRGTYKVNFDQNSPRAVYAPMPIQGEGQVNVPVGPGTVHVWIVNFNNQSIAATFSAKYVGFHTH
jgi:hypothetical protein